MTFVACGLKFVMCGLRILVCVCGFIFRFGGFGIVAVDLSPADAFRRGGGGGGNDWRLKRGRGG